VELDSDSLVVGVRKIKFHRGIVANTVENKLRRVRIKRVTYPSQGVLTGETFVTLDVPPGALLVVSVFFGSELVNMEMTRGVC
jgi:hypothetical protein